MSEPVSYTPKTLTPVTAMYTGMMSENIADVINWLATLLPEDAEIYDNQMGGAYVQNGLFTMQFSQNQYVYLDEDGFHSVSAGTFELNFTETTS